MSQPSAIRAVLLILVQLAPLMLAMGFAALPFWYYTFSN